MAATAAGGPRQSLAQTLLWSAQARPSPADGRRPAARTVTGHRHAHVQVRFVVRELHDARVDLR